MLTLTKMALELLSNQRRGQAIQSKLCDCRVNEAYHRAIPVRQQSSRRLPGLPQARSSTLAINGQLSAARFEAIPPAIPPVNLVLDCPIGSNAGGGAVEV